MAQTQTTIDKKQYSGVALRAMNMLANGATQKEAALALGVTESLVSQFMAEADFQSQLHDKIAKNMLDAQEIDNNYVETERVLSKRLREQSNLMFNPDSVLRTLKFVNEAKKKVAANFGAQPHVDGGNGQKVLPVVLVLPQVVQREFVLNPNNEIVAIDDQPLVTLNSNSLNQLVAKQKDATKVLPQPNGTLQRKTSKSDLTEWLDSL